MAVQTGLRSGELRELNRGHLYLDVATPYIRAKAATTKNSKDARQFLSADVAAALKAHVAHKAPQAPVFNMPSGRDEMAAMLLADVAAARSAWLKAAADDSVERLRREQCDFLQERNDKGEVLDFHALRHTCGAWYIEAGAGPKEVQTLMRHATITLTLDTYGHLFQGQESETVKKLRPLLNNADSCQRKRQRQNSARAGKGRPLPLTAARGLMIWKRLTPFGTITLTLTAAHNRRVPLWTGPRWRVSELASGLTRNQVPRKGLWVRIPCPPLRLTTTTDDDRRRYPCTCKGFRSWLRLLAAIRRRRMTLSAARNAAHLQRPEASFRVLHDFGLGSVLGKADSRPPWPDPRCRYACNASSS